MIVWNTGCTSVGEPADNAEAPRPLPSDAPGPPRNSALRSWISLNSRTFSMAMTAWSTNVSSKAMCGSVKGPHLHTTNPNHSKGTPSRCSGVASAGRWPAVSENSQPGTPSQLRQIINVESVTIITTRPSGDDRWTGRVRRR